MIEPCGICGDRECPGHKIMTKDMKPGYRIHDPWQDYLTKTGHHNFLEVVPWYMFHTKKFSDPRQLRFFTDTNFWDLSNEEDSNIQVAGMLPNPCSYLIEGIRIFGLTSNLINNARIRIHIGNKVMADTSALAYIERWKLPDIAMIIPPLVAFEVILKWKHPIIFGFDRVPLITIMFKGQMARSVN